jgi:S-formylglutathione hydrolase FrmB
MNKLLLLFVTALLIFTSSTTYYTDNTPSRGPSSFTDNPPDSLVKLKNGNELLNVYIKIPNQKHPIGTIVVLPGWNLPVLDWCTKTTLCQKALKQGYILIMPEMAKSVYSYELFPETRKDWLTYTTRRWFIDTLIPYFQKQYKLLLHGQKNYLLGLSTGARGVALLSLDCPEIFIKAAGLSGDYDQTQMPKDNLMTGYYGTFTSFKDRWTGRDNVVYRFKELSIPIYLGHGKADKVVPCQQTIQFADSLKKYKPNLVTLHLDKNAGHTYGYWDSEVDHVLRYFATP